MTRDDDRPEIEGLPPEEIERIRRVLRAAVARTCPRWLAEQRDDLVQAAFVRIFNIWKKSEESTPPSTSYVWKAAYSATMDEIRRARTRREESMDASADGTDAKIMAVEPIQARHGAELRGAIAEGLHTLTPDRRRAVQLYLAGFSLKETSAMLGWPPKRVDNERYRGLAALRAFLERKGLSP